MVRWGPCMFVLVLVSLSEAHLETLQCFKGFKNFFFWGEGCDADGVTWDCDFFLSHGTSFTQLVLPSPHLYPVCHGKRDTKFVFWSETENTYFSSRGLCICTFRVAVISSLSYIQVSNVCTVCTASAFLEENKMVSFVLSRELKLRRQWNDLPMIFKHLFHYY